jgi:hypothetical protein
MRFVGRLDDRLATEVIPEVVTATIRGVRANQAQAGCPNFGKLSARRAPDRMASAKSRA